MSTLTLYCAEDGTSHAIPCPGGDAGEDLASLLARHGTPLNTRCGRRGMCRGCEVALRSGSVAMDGAMVSGPAVIRACQARMAGDVVLEIPARSRVEHMPQVGESFRIDIPVAHQPLFTPAPGARDTGFAIDIGTTTVVVQLVDLTNGALLDKAGGFNAQIRFGDNVLTRIDAASDPRVRRAQQAAVVRESLVPLLERACQRSGRTPARLAGGTIAGNTTMLHLLLDVDPTPLGMAPFTPAFLTRQHTTCGDIGLDIAGPDGLAPSTPLQLLPGISGYVGADILAGVYATGMAYAAAPALLVDVGTNGEMVLQSGGKLFACATAAGPAFEGCGLRCGTRARAGAVSALRMRGQPPVIEASTIGGTSVMRAEGICGSAYIDFLAEGRRCGLLAANGRFDLQCWDSLPEGDRICMDDARAVRVAGGAGAAAVVVSEVDVALLLQAKAAIGAGMEILLDAAGIAARDIGRLYLAGGFGMHLDVAHAIAIGLLPGFRAEQVEVVGNTSLAGAVLAMLDRTTLAEMDDIRAGVEVVELNLHDGFEDCYIDHLMLP